MLNTDQWTEKAACGQTSAEAFFIRGHPQQRHAKRMCSSCPIRIECLADALDNRIRFGVWGGLSEKERRSLLRSRPDVDSWRPVLEQAHRASDGSLTI
ncbi:WhiB family transcriptional regulator [Streptomyces sp. NPDC087908]|uniref:WhiB family transcriptional regulator n=1 Tax=Streptomyces sp. NPDC087908 TaxID=3365820 RepID=UPI0038042F7D